MFIGKVFKANPNFAILETLTAILRDPVYIENNMVMAVSVFKIAKYGFALKNELMNIYHIDR